MTVFKFRASLPHLGDEYMEVVPYAVLYVLLFVPCFKKEDEEQEQDNMWELLPIEIYISFSLSANKPPIATPFA